MTFNTSNLSPVAVGGVGGSGTRLIAAILQKLGVFMGSDLNREIDNLAFTLLFKRPELWPPEQHGEEIGRAMNTFLNTMYYRKPWSESDIRFIQSLTHTSRPNYPEEWPSERAEHLINNLESEQITSPWGWKEPNTHIVLPALIELVPNLRYIHVMRHGLDMAFSSNQNQLRLWGSQLLNEPALELTPSNSFRYWCAAHRRIRRIGENMGSNYLLLNFDQFCQAPETETQKLLTFLNIDIPVDLSEVLGLVSPPPSIGRYKKQPLDIISPADLDFLLELGYSYEPKYESG